VKVVILAGGMGTRLRSVVSDLPKPLAPVAGMPYLQWVLNALQRKGVTDVILSVGYMADKFAAFIQQLASSSANINIELLVEPEPLGTGGALRLCCERYPDTHYLVLNGDSYCDFDIGRVINLGEQRNSAMVVAHVENISRYGEVVLNEDDSVKAFNEKRSANVPGWINAGVYVIPATALENTPDAVAFSLEQRVIPELLCAGLFAVKADGDFIDIGIPEDYKTVCENPRRYFQ
jgi:D-glycero-alpha-D-manno-heptose 1-phosphate guanylyltransferase